MKILFIGGNGNISWQCVQVALERGHEVWELNRGQTVATRRKKQKEVHLIIGDKHDFEYMQIQLEGVYFDIVCDFICYSDVHAQMDIQLFSQKTKHFVFISSDSVYERQNMDDVYSESSRRYDIRECDCSYIRGKILAEDCFLAAYKEQRFPVTIIRPAYTYDTIVPISIGHNCFTAVSKLLEGYPILVAGNGKNKWSFTHAKDFAKAFVQIIENGETVGDVIQIMSEDYITWNEESEILLKVLGLNRDNIYNVKKEEALNLEEIQPRMLMLHRIYNSKGSLKKLKEYVPNWHAEICIERGLRETFSWLLEQDVRRRYIKKIDDTLTQFYRMCGLNKN